MTDLFSQQSATRAGQDGQVAHATPLTSCQPPLPVAQRFTLPCDCATKRSAMLSHYQIVRCPDCNCYFWALQPKRHGPLKIFPWPGNIPIH